jgi:hypothetical protein
VKPFTSRIHQSCACARKQDIISTSLERGHYSHELIWTTSVRGMYNITRWQRVDYGSGDMPVDAQSKNLRTLYKTISSGSLNSTGTSKDTKGLKQLRHLFRSPVPHSWRSVSCSQKQAKEGKYTGRVFEYTYSKAQANSTGKGNTGPYVNCNQPSSSIPM